MKSVEEAAELLVRTINLPARHHAVWIRTEQGDKDRETRNVIMVALHPSLGLFPPIPDEIMGVPVRQCPWQPDDVRDHPEWHETVAKIAQGTS